MNLALKMTTAYLDSRGTKYSIVDDDGKVMSVIFSGLDNMEKMKVMVFFDDDNSSCCLKSFNYCKFPENKKPKMYEVCSKMNEDYRWVKFFVDESDNTITVQDDAVIQLDSCGEEVMELIAHMVTIGDKAYPNFMRALWG